MECSLVMFKSDGTRKDIPLVGDRSVIGRMSSCEIRIPLGSVSREHCELLCDGNVLKYKDLNSSNGVTHNGAKRKHGVLAAGDELIVGPVVFTVMIDGKPSKITPVRTILNDDSDDALQGRPAKDASGSKSATKITDGVLFTGAVGAEGVFNPPSSGAEDSGAEEEVVDAIPIGGDDDWATGSAMVEQEAQTMSAEAVPDRPSMPPVAEVAVAVPTRQELRQEAMKETPKDGLASMPGEGSGGFEFFPEDEEGSEEEPAFTFD